MMIGFSFTIRLLVTQPHIFQSSETPSFNLRTFKVQMQKNLRLLFPFFRRTCFYMFGADKKKWVMEWFQSQREACSSFKTLSRSPSPQPSDLSGDESGSLMLAKWHFSISDVCRSCRQGNKKSEACIKFIYFFALPLPSFFYLLVYFSEFLSVSAPLYCFMFDKWLHASHPSDI